MYEPCLNHKNLTEMKISLIKVKDNTYTFSTECMKYMFSIFIIYLLQYYTVHVLITAA